MWRDETMRRMSTGSPSRTRFALCLPCKYSVGKHSFAKKNHQAKTCSRRKRSRGKQAPLYLCTVQIFFCAKIIFANIHLAILYLANIVTYTNIHQANMHLANIQVANIHQSNIDFVKFFQTTIIQQTFIQKAFIQHTFTQQTCCNETLKKITFIR